MKLSIITINFKKPDLTISCCGSLYKNYKDFFGKNKFELLIVDNFSQDDSIKKIQKVIKKEKYKNVILLEHKENNGFGGGNNFGVKHAKGEYLLFLNNDTTVEEGLEGMLTFLEDHPEIGVVGGPLRNESGNEQSSAGKFYSLQRVFFLLLGFQRFGLFDKNPLTVDKVDWVKGALFLIKKDFFEKLKGFDENIFMYTEDMELCYRARLAGKSTYFYPDIRVFHKDHGSSNRSFAIIHIYEGILYFYKKHKGKLEQKMVQLMLKSKAIFLISLGKILKNEYLISTYEKAFSVLG